MKLKSLRVLGLIFGLSCASASFAANIAAAEDAWLNGAAGHANQNFGSAATFQVFHGQQRGLIRFDLFSYAGDRRIVKATLLLKVTKVSHVGALRLYRLTSPWQESVVTAANDPSVAPSPVATRQITAADAGKTISIDVSSAVRKWFATPASNFGFQLGRDDSTTADVTFSSREGGTAPVLVVSVQNQVVVSPINGDYPDPITAANNAFAGDKWCIRTPPSRPACVLNIAAGIYILPSTLQIPANVALVGEEKREVQLVAGNAVTGAAVVSQGPEVADLSIITTRPGLVALVFSHNLNRVALVAPGLALMDQSSDGRLAVTDSELIGSVRVDQNGTFSAHRSRFQGTIFAERLTHLTLDQCEIEGEGSAVDVRDTHGDIEITGSSISAQSSLQAEGFHFHDFVGSLMMLNTKIHVIGGSDSSGVVLDRDSGVGADIFDGVTIQAEDAVRELQESPETLQISRSYLQGTGAALSALGFPGFSHIEIDQSFLNGTLGVSDAAVTVTSTVLAGPVLLDPGAVCKNVYDAQFVLHKNDCPTN